VLNERRYVIYNSRRLSGECLSSCTEEDTIITDLEQNSVVEAPIGTSQIDIECITQTSCNECLDNSCAWTPQEGCLKSCDIIADINCYDASSTITNDETCSQADEDESDLALCSGLSDCTSCVDTTLLSDSTTTCKWFEGSNQNDGFCGSQCGLLGCGETACLASNDDNGGGGQAMEGCLCDVNDFEWDQSWKCGNDIYVCPSVNEICSTQGSKESKYYSLSKDQCTAMRSVDLGQNCLALPEYGIVKPNSVSNRVCYKNKGSLGFDGMKQDSDSCETCPSKMKIEFETPTVGLPNIRRKQ